MRNLLFLIALAIVFTFSSCEKTEISSDSTNVATLKSGKKVMNFTAHLTGKNEVSPVETKAIGQAIFQLNMDGTELSYTLIVANIENVLMSHIHIAPVGVNGPVVVWLYPSSAPPMLISGVSNGILAKGVITGENLTGPLAGMTLTDLVDQLQSGNAYVNVHTSQNPGGEIRGQIKGNMGNPNN